MGFQHAVAIGLGLTWVASPVTASADPAGYCDGEYAEDLAALSPHARDLETKTGTYSYAVRTTATYECVSYGSDGNLKRTRASALAYGTAFGFRRDGGDTLLLTNHHVAEWPGVTDNDHVVDGVPAGCKRIADALSIVDDDHDDYPADDIPLSRVVTDPALDVAVLRAHGALGVIPWRVGKSAALVARDAVEVRGFPLGEFRATNVGKVISAYDHDDQGAWNHDDFVVDALLTSGGSGSPVLAVSCKTGEFELVGIFHAHYNGASALNVVVAIDQVRDLMTTLKRSPHTEPTTEPDADARARLAGLARHSSSPPFFAMGALVASVHVRPDGVLVFALYSADFPRVTEPVLVVEDLAPSGSESTGFGSPGRTYVRTQGGLRACAAADVDAESQAMLARALAMFRADAVATFDDRASATGPTASRDAFQRATKRRRAFTRQLEAQHDAVQSLVDLADKLASHTTGPALGLAELVLAQPAS
jgi:serine protease Do